MTLHTAKGLEFPVFLTGLEDGVFPHQRALARRTATSWRRSAGWPTSASPGPASGSTSPARSSARPGARPSTTRRAGSSTSCPTTWSTGGVPRAATTSWRNTSATRPPRPGGTRSATAPGRRSAQIPILAAGDRVLHTTFGMGKVVATSGEGDKAMADVDFGSSGLKRLSLRHAPLEKL